MPWSAGCSSVPHTDRSSVLLVKTDTTTQGTWKGVYGSDGEAIYSDSANYPAYAQVAFSGDSAYVWTRIRAARCAGSAESVGL